MRKLALLLFLSPLATFGQNFACQFSFKFTQATGFASQPAPTAFDNRLKGCNNFTMQYQAIGLSAVNLQLNSAGGPQTQGAFAIYGGSVVSGTNPATSLTGTQTTFSGYVGWLQVALTGTASGATWAVTGIVSGSITPGVTGSSSGCPNPCPVVGNAAAGGAPSGAPVLVAGQDGAPGNVQVVKTDTVGELIPANTSINFGADPAANTNPTPAGAAGARMLFGTVPNWWDGLALRVARGNNTGMMLSNATSTNGNGLGPSLPGFSLLDQSQFIFSRSIDYHWNGTTYDKRSTASLANFPTGTTLTARNSIGAGLTENSSRWVVNDGQPAAGTVAIATIAAEAGVRHVLSKVCFSGQSTAAVTAASVSVNIRDGASGAGTILAVFATAFPTAGGTGVEEVQPFCTQDLNLVGTTNTAMTAEFNTGIVNATERIFMTGYNVN